MEPSHVPSPDRGAQALDLEAGDLVILDQGHHSGSTPSADGIEIKIKVPVPLPRKGRVLLLTRTEGDADLAAVPCKRDFGNLKRVGLAGLDNEGVPLQFWISLDACC